MNVVISHDVDHLTLREHRTDLIIPKFIARFGIEWFLGYTGWREVGMAIRSLWSGAWQHIGELMDFDQAHGVPSTFFVAVANGRKLSYSLADARKWITKMRDRGFDIGVHGIEYESPDRAREELGLFREISGLETVGARMHNIGYSASSVLLDHSDVLRLKGIGYSYTSTTFGVDDAWSSGAFWEFPVHLMDTHVFMVGRPWKNRTPEQMRRSTIERLKGAADRGIRHFSLLFHDIYFCDYYRDYKEWYIWLIEYLKTEGYPLCSYRDALRELNGEERTPSA